MEGKLHQANENRKRRMMNQNGPHHTHKYRNNSSEGFTPRHNKPTAQTYRPNYPNNNGGPPKPGGNNNNSHNNNNNHNNNGNNGNNNKLNTGPRTGSNAIPVTPKDKSTVTCYECGTVGHYSKECPKKLAKTAPNTAAPAQQQRRFAARRNQNNHNGCLYHMNATEAQEAPQAMPNPRHLPDTILSGGEQEVDHNHPCQHHMLTPVDTTISLRAHRKPTRPPAPPTSSHSRTPATHAPLTCPRTRRTSRRDARKDADVGLVLVCPAHDASKQATMHTYAPTPYLTL
ncbi:hypothetical protein QYE76_036540 [Lolium multiflorum]|uniref:CCHC-type domain-containing protein n=1 Tax=Lolium multiflorum TaxID=4521 RepID=A0AAD8R2Z8_LOLMU|nr:hypothetical protein QYE76_036540 [Lolium multiflorum]